MAEVQCFHSDVYTLEVSNHFRIFTGVVNQCPQKFDVISPENLIRESKWNNSDAFKAQIESALFQVVLNNPCKQTPVQMQCSRYLSHWLMLAQPIKTHEGESRSKDEKNVKNKKIVEREREKGEESLALGIVKEMTVGD